MINLYANVIGHKMTLSDSNTIPDSSFSLPTGSRNVDAVQFTFSGDDWIRTTKYAVFWQDRAAIYTAEINSAGLALIPEGALQKQGIVYVAAYGDNGTLRITTNACAFPAEQGAMTAETAPEPSQSLVEAAVETAIAGIIDTTLAVSGKAADAAAVGAALDQKMDAYISGEYAQGKVLHINEYGLVRPAALTDILLTGYTDMTDRVSPISAADSIMTAIQKLNKRLTDLEG